jgi:hypothetical protein
MFPSVAQSVSVKTLALIQQVLKSNPQPSSKQKLSIKPLLIFSKKTSRFTVTAKQQPLKKLITPKGAKFLISTLGNPGQGERDSGMISNRIPG